jgi:PilZ domain
MEKRQYPRYPIEAPAVLQVEGRPGPFLVTVLDVSAAGLRLSSPVALPRGTKVGIKCLSRQLSGEIRYSRPMEASGFHIGVLVESVSGSAGEFDLLSLFRRS